MKQKSSPGKLLLTLFCIASWIPGSVNAATEIGSSGIFFNNLPNGTVEFFSDAAETTPLGEADPNDITDSLVRPCDADNGADGLSTLNSLPVTLASADYASYGADILPPNATSGHCFYRLSNNTYAAIRNMSNSGESSMIPAYRIYACPDTVTVTSSGLDLDAVCTAAADQPVAPIPVLDSPIVLSLALLLTGGLLSRRLNKTRAAKT